MVTASGWEARISTACGDWPWDWKAGRLAGAWVGVAEGERGGWDGASSLWTTTWALVAFGGPQAQFEYH